MACFGFSLVRSMLRRLEKRCRRLGLIEKTFTLRDSATVMRCWVPDRASPGYDPSKPPLMLVHGFAANGIAGWEHQLSELSRNFALYVPDLVFFGGSTTSDERARSEFFQARCMLEILEAEGVDGAAVAGTSYGGFVAFRMAELDPARVKKVVIASSGVCMDPHSNDATLDAFQARHIHEVLMPTSVAVQKKSIQLCLYKRLWLPDCLVQDLMEVYGGNRKERIELLDGLEVLILVGSHDRIFDLELAKQLKAHLGENATLVVIEKTGHVPQRRAMFEGWVFSLVAGYLGNYIKDIHREQFRIGLWSGVALLENAELRLEAFDYLQLPFAIKQGFVGKLRLQVSWKTLLWEPILIALEDVHICACPRDESEWNATAAESRELAAKKAKLAAAEITKLSKQVPDEKVRQSLLSHLLAKVIDNIQVTIRNIHIRYVDKKDDPEGSFYFGVKLAGLSVGTTDARGAGNSAAKTKSGFVHKSVEINKLSVYWNSSSAPTVSRNLTSTLGNYLNRWFAKKDENLSYILYPMDASIKLTVNRSATSDGGAPLYALAMSMDKLDLNLSDRQLYEMFLLIDSFEISRIRERYGRFRPHVGLSTEERSSCHWQHLWWKYAINAVLADVRKRLRRSSWRYLAWRLDCRRRYVTLYKEKLLCFQEGQAPEDDIIYDLEELEKELDLEMISSFRDLAERKYELEEMPDEDNEGHNRVSESVSHPRGWLNVFSFGMLGKSATMDSAAEFTGPLSDEIMKDIYKATNFHPALLLENDSSKGYCLLSMNLHLRQAVGRLENSCTKLGIVEVVTSGIFTTFRKLQDVATGAVACKAFEVKDVCTEGTLYPHVAISKGSYSNYAASTRGSYAEAVSSLYIANGNGTSQRDAAIRIDVELSEDLGVKVSVFMRPFEVIYSRSVADGLLNFLKLPTSCGAEEFYTDDSTEIQSALLTRLSLNVDARDVVFIIPNDSVSSNSVLAIPLESMHFSMANMIGFPSKEHGQAVLAASQNHLKDFSGSVINHFEVKLAGIQARFAKGTNSGEESRFSWVTVMDKFNADFDIKKIKDSWDTRWKVDGSLSATTVLVSAVVYSGLGAIIDASAKPFLQSQSRREGRESTTQPISGELFIKNVSVQLVLSDEGSIASVKAISLHIEPLKLRFSSDALQDKFALLAGKLYMENMDSQRPSLDRCLFSTLNDSNGLSLTITRNWNEGGPVRSALILQDAECHIHRNVIAALTGFVLEISELRPTATGESSLHQAPFSLALQLDNVSFLMHDVYGVLATLVLSKSEFFMLSSAPEDWELEGKASDLQISAPEFATHGMNGIPFRRLNSQQPSSIHLSVVKKSFPFPTLEIQADLEGIECILHSDYLVLLIGFFRSSEWKSTYVSAPAVEPTQLSVPYQVKVKNSVLILPIGGGHHFDVGIPEFCFSFVPLKLTGNFRKSHPEWYSVEDASDSPFKLFYIRGRQLTLSNYGLEPWSGDRWFMPLIDMLTGDILIEAPDTSDRKNKLTNIHIKFPVIQLSCIGHALHRQIEWVDFLSMELASVGWKSLHATDIWEGIISGKPFIVTQTAKSKPSFNLQWQSDQLTSSLKLSRKEEPGLLDTVAVLEARSTTAAYSVEAGFFQHFGLKLDNVVIFDPSYKLKDGNVRKKLVVSVKSETSNIAIEALPLNPSKIQVDILVPRLEVWLRFSSWNKIISWMFVCIPLDTTPSIPADTVAVLLEMGTTVGSVLHLKTTVPSLMLFLPDCSSENQRLTEDDELGKAVLFTSSFFIDEFEVLESRCTFSARFTQVKAETKSRQLSGYPCLATANIHIGGVFFLEFPVPSLALTACVDSIDCWCSYPILQFLNAFELESSIEDEEESLLLEYKVGLKAEILMLSLLLTDGRWNYNCPLMEMIFEKTFLELSFSRGSVDILASTLTEISYHNIEKVVWEPFLEPWRFTGVFHFAESAAKVEIESANSLNINVTEALSQASTRALEMITSSRMLDLQRHVVESLQQNVFSQYAPYWFQNDTGMTVSYSLIWPGWNGDKSLENDSTWQWRTVLAGSSVPLFVSEDEGSIRYKKKARWISSRVSEQKKIGLMSHRRIRVRLEGTSGASLPMSIDLVGRRAFEVSFSGKETDRSDEGKQFSTHAVLEVSLQHHSKLIRLHSTVTVANSTSVPMEVRLEIPFGIAPKIMNPILPSEVIPLPVHLAETGRISWRPYKKDYLWSEAQPLSKLLSTNYRSASQRPFVCYPSRPSQGPFRCCVSVEEKEVSTAIYASKSSSDKLPVTSEQSARWKMWNVLLQAPLVIMNCLPCAMDVIVESGAGVNAHTSIPKGDSGFFYEVDVVHDLNIKATISSFLLRTVKFGRAASRDRVERTERPINDEMTIFDPENPSGLPVYARVDKVTDLRSGARRLSLIVPYWIYNCSGLNLSFLDGEVDVHVAKEQSLPDTYSAGGTAAATEAQGMQSLIATSTGRNQSGRMLSHLPSCKIFTPAAETSPAAADSHCNDSVLPLARIYSPTTREVGESKMRLRAAQLLESTTPFWSQPFLLDPPGGNAPIVIPKPTGKGAYVLSITSIPAMGSCSGKTKTVTFRPRFVLANASRQDICFKQHGTDIFYPLAVGQNINVHWSDTTRTLLLSLRYNEHGWDWSGGFSLDRLGDTQVKVYNHLTGVKEMLRVVVSDANAAGDSIGSGNDRLGTFYIIVTNDETGFMPYRIDNFSKEKLRFYQKKCEKTENVLQPYSSCDYAWDEPCLPPQLVIEVPGEGTLGTYPLDVVKSYPSIQFHASGQKPEGRFVVSVHAEASRRVLSVVDLLLHTTKDLRMLNPRIEETFRDSRKGSSQDFSLKLASIAISLVDTTPQELALASARGFELQFFQTQLEQKMKMEIALLQVDNQLRHAIYPVLLSTAKSSGILMRDIISSEWNSSRRLAQEKSENPALSAIVSKWRHPIGSVHCYQCIYLSIAPLRLQLEERNLSCLLELFKGLFVGGSATGTEKSMSFKLQRSEWGSSSNVLSSLRFVETMEPIESYKTWPDNAAVEPAKGPTQKLIISVKQRRKVYVEAFHIDPLELTVSFSSIPWLPKESRGVAAQSLLWVTGSLVQRRLIALADVEGAPIRLRHLTLAHPMANWNSILGIIQRHYTRQLLHELYKVLGSADVFGNPMSFLRSLGSGVWDFVYAPATSIRQNPGQIVQGVTVGTRSLFRNTVFAFSNAATQMSKAARKGMAALALDQDYMNEGENQWSRDSSIVNEFLEGLTGLLQSSVRGAERHGIPGVFSGMAVGVIRAVARPAASMLEVAGKTAQSIRNSSQPSQPRIMRLRLPRHLEPGSPLLPYSWNEALGTAVLREADDGRLREETYITCQPLFERGVFVLLTENLLIQVKSTSREELESSGCEWSLLSENNVEDILYMYREENNLDVLFCSPNALLASKKRDAASQLLRVDGGIPLDTGTLAETQTDDAAHSLYAKRIRLPT
ncbi:hypothetical protein SELMODRAFT_439148 [Selaginella moellendorffii]|uniref:PH domain-containing protein n=1 Tax=Selaginella moellendorffii TaxID=88036 RepID=D8R2T3_SELML|nr:hypothetical protein SELMODRAFT_439148 [Selaginella moellendorffii]